MARVNPVIWLLLLQAILIFSCAAHAEPRAALQYRNALIREARFEWGLIAPVALFAGQIEAESAWNPNACSAFACGLAQFTPATADDVAERVQPGLKANVFSPAWALRALVLYDHDLYKRITADTDCDHWGFTLSAYNGGLGNVRKDQAICDTLGMGCVRTRWRGHVALHSGRAASAFAENRRYARTILETRQITYATWGAQIPCLSS